MCINSRNIVPAIILLSLLMIIEARSFDKLIEKCMAEHDISKDEYEAVMNQASSEEDLDNVEMKFKCAIQCLATEMEMVDSNGYWDVELFANYQELSDEQRGYFYECKRVHDVELDMCEYGFRMSLCLKEKMGSDYYSASEESEEEQR